MMTVMVMMMVVMMVVVMVVMVVMMIAIMMMIAQYNVHTHHALHVPEYSPCAVRSALPSIRAKHAWSFCLQYCYCWWWWWWWR